MEDSVERITKMENIMTKQENILESMEKLLNELDSNQKNYENLFDYYYSDIRNQDLKDEENHCFPENLRRGVLSEDELYNLFSDSHDLAIHMIETALNILKIN